MSMPFYVAPEQQMKDRADFARKGIARGRSVVVLHYADGIVFVAENRSQALHKVSEIYDRIGFAAVGRYNEFENLRIAGIRHADLRGYSYDRRDVTGRGLANAYAQLLGTIFSSGGEKPYEVELIVAELGAGPAEDQIYRLTYDGSVQDEADLAVMGGSADAIAAAIREGFQAELSLSEAIALAVRGLGSDGGPAAPVREIGVEALEVAVLDRTRALPRKFRRIAGEQLARVLAGPAAGGPDGAGSGVDAGAGAESETETVETRTLEQLPEVPAGPDNAGNADSPDNADNADSPQSVDPADRPESAGGPESVDRPDDAEGSPYGSPS